MYEGERVNLSVIVTHSNSQKPIKNHSNQYKPYKPYKHQFS